MFCHLKTAIWQETALVVAVRLYMVDATSLGCHHLIAGRGEVVQEENHAVFGHF